MKIDHELIEQVTGIPCLDSLMVETLAFSNSTLPHTLTFLDDQKFLAEINNNSNIAVVITTKALAEFIQSGKHILISEDPRFDFYTLLNKVGRSRYKQWNSIISGTATIHETAFVSPFNVIIGNNTLIEPNVTILNDVEIGDHCIVRSGSVIGAEGFEHKRTSKGILSVYHDGKVIIGNNVHIGALNAISKGFSFRNTIIGDDCKTDNLVHIAHAVQIGKRGLFPASCMIAGSVTIEDDVWIGPNASVSSGLTIHKNAYITLGSVVTKNVPEGEKVTGNFAVPHRLFMANLKKTIENK
jgi:UDP-3-O-[3-hydroxymyristoyl] glucosamine N-acyltransferase